MTGWHFVNESDYIKRPDWMLMKLHGSVTWCRVAQYDGPDTHRPNPDCAMELADQLPLEDEQALPFEMWTGTNQEAGFRQVYIPALAVPMANKTRFECPKLHVDALQSCMTKVTRLLICGWRAAESHAIDLLDGMNPGYDLGVVSGNRLDLAEVLTNLGTVVDKGKLYVMAHSGMSGLASDMSQLNILTGTSL